MPPEQRSLTDSLTYRRLSQGVLEAERCGRAVSDEQQEAALYSESWAEFWTWCEGNGHGGAALPVSIDALVHWLAWAAEELSDRDIERILAAVRKRHMDAGLATHIEGLGG